ncbi:response regulator [Geomonas paludis]|uniref:Response regulator n=1 Tax=Geomonas paludis TaxID=2740185 RepID=A0A6V8MQU7_9BACT|nr:response regulator [Geomonas paludis]UPU36091.1 response regulator [Geomonas paludis]GFO62302.1 response regulator [Geomonas paludis]
MALKDVRILIVDDEKFYRDSLRDILGRIGFTVVAEAADGIEAVRMFLTHRPHIVIMDVYMPVKNGIDATREMVALNKNANVLTSSASDCPSDTNAVLKVGAKAILKKPFEPREIYDTIKQVLGGS